MPCKHSIRTASIDLFLGPGLRVSARQLDRETELVLQFHHSCCDAIGALRFVEDLLVAYTAAIGDFAKPTPFRPIDDQRLLDRARVGMTPKKLLGMVHKQAVGLLGTRQFLMRRPVPIQPITMESATAALPGDFPSAHAHHFSESETAGLMATAREAGTTVNDLLCRDLFLALGDFRAKRELGDGSEWLRLSIPMNLRHRDDQQMSAANVVSMVFLDRRPPDFADGQALLRGIGREMRSIKKNQLGLTFPLALRFTRCLPGAIGRLRRMSKQQVCRVTTVLSNLGQPLRDVPLSRRDEKIVAGGMILERLEFLPPVRPYTMAALGASTYANRLQIALHFDARCLTTVDAEALLHAYVDRLHKSASKKDSMR
jgi:hypothetical protein